MRACDIFDPSTTVDVIYGAADPGVSNGTLECKQEARVLDYRKWSGSSCRSGLSTLSERSIGSLLEPGVLGVLVMPGRYPSSASLTRGLPGRVRFPGPGQAVRVGAPLISTSRVIPKPLDGLRPVPSHPARGRRCRSGLQKRDRCDDEREHGDHERSLRERRLVMG